MTQNGASAKIDSPVDTRIARLQSELATARRVIEVQGKLSALLEQFATGSADATTGGELKG